MMINGLNRRLVGRWALLLTFLLVTLTINFFHTEEVVESFRQEEATHTHSPPEPQRTSQDCPACHFFNAGLGTAPAAVIALPPPVLRRGHPDVDTVHYEHLFKVSPSSRSPPAV